MTESDKKTTIINTPFDASSAQEGGWNLPNTAGSGNVPNWSTGFPSAYGLPLSDGGKYVKRSELNHILRVFSNVMFNAQNGFPNLWSQYVSTAIGGYPEGAVVWYEYDNSLILLRSTTNNNDTPPVSGGTINIDFSGGTSRAWAKIDFGLLSKDGGTLGNNAVTFTKGGTNSTLTLKGGTGTDAGALTLYGNKQAVLSAGSGANETKLIVSNGVAQVQQGSAVARNIVRSINGSYADPNGNVVVQTGVRIGIGSTTDYIQTSTPCVVDQEYTVEAGSFFIAVAHVTYHSSRYGEIQMQAPGMPYITVAGSSVIGTWSGVSAPYINFSATTFSDIKIRFLSSVVDMYLYTWKPRT